MITKSFISIIYHLILKERSISFYKCIIWPASFCAVYVWEVLLTSKIYLCNETFKLVILEHDGKVRNITCWLSACRSGSWAAPGLGSHPWHCHCSGWLRVPGATSRSTVFGYQTSDFTTSDQRSQFYHKLVLHIQSNKWLMPRMVLQFSRGILSRRPYPGQVNVLFSANQILRNRKPRFLRSLPLW